MRPGDAACTDCRPGQFRLPGRGGAGLFLRSTTAPGDQSEPRLAVDVGVLTPTAWTTNLARPMDAGTAAALSAFLAGAATGEAHFADELLGLQCDARPGPGADVTVRIRISDGPDDGVDLVTSPAVLERAAHEVLVLENAQGSR